MILVNREVKYFSNKQRTVFVCVLFFKEEYWRILFYNEKIFHLFEKYPDLK